MSMPDLIIGDVTIPHLAGLDLTQEYGDVVSEAWHRMGSGTLEVQENWAKRSTTISGSGWIPAAFSSIDFSADQVIQCIALESVQDASNVLTVPAARRSDVSPLGFALVDGREVPTPLTMEGNVATLTAVTGAAFYQVKYYPVITCRIHRPRRGLSRNNATYTWTLEAEEV
jgi:hypothetical protein